MLPQWGGLNFTSHHTKKQMRRVLIVVIAIVALRASVWADPSVKSYLMVDHQVLAQCQQHMTSACFADIAWALARDEKQGMSLGGLASSFAQLKQWDRAERLLARIPEKKGAPLSFERSLVAAERLAFELAAGNDASLKTVQDDLTLGRTASRLLGHLPNLDVGRRRLNRGLSFTRVKADRAMELALVQHWAHLPTEGRHLSDQVNLANAFFLAGNESRAREMALAITPTPGVVFRDLIDLLTLLNEQERALEVAQLEDAKHRPLYMVLVAESFARDRQDAKRATHVALEAAEAALSQRKFDLLERISGLLSSLDKEDQARLLAVRAEKEAQRPDLFRPHRLSEVGSMYGAAGDQAACLRLQAEAVDATQKSSMGFGLVAGSVGYDKGRFDLQPELIQLVALRRFECGDAGALNEVNIHHLSSNYCLFHGRGLIGPADISRKPDMVPVLADAAECHIERNEPEHAFALLQQIEAESQTSLDYSNRFLSAYQAAEVACVYSDSVHCRKNLHAAGRALINEVASRRLSAQRVINFAVAWQFRVEPSTMAP